MRPKASVWDSVCFSEWLGCNSSLSKSGICCCTEPQRNKESSTEASSLRSFHTVCHPDKHEHLIYQCCLVAKRCHSYLSQPRLSAARFVSLSSSRAIVVTRWVLSLSSPVTPFLLSPKWSPMFIYDEFSRTVRTDFLVQHHYPFAWHRSRKELVWAGNHQALQSNKFHYYNENPKTWKQYTELPWLILLCRHT